MPRFFQRRGHRVRTGGGAKCMQSTKSAPVSHVRCTTTRIAKTIGSRGGTIATTKTEIQDQQLRSPPTTMDFQNRAGSKPGSGGVASSSTAAVHRRERLRRLAMETIDVSKDPYILRNHLGTYECKLCLTLHSTEGNYLAHTQGKRHQTNLLRRARMEEIEEAKRSNRADSGLRASARRAVKKRSIKIGRPGYKVTKLQDPVTGQRALEFELSYPEIKAGLQPRHRIMSAYEQTVEPRDSAFQYVLFAAEPYETVAFKVPSLQVDRREGKFMTRWDRAALTFTLRLHFVDAPSGKSGPSSGGRGGGVSVGAVGGEEGAVGPKAKLR